MTLDANDIFQTAHAVEIILLSRGHAAVRGFAGGPLPPVIMRETPGARSTFDGLTITVDPQGPSGCFRVYLAHELTHYALGKYEGLIGRQSEAEADAVAAAVAAASDDYIPNCK